MLVLTRPRDPKDAAIDRVNVDIIVLRLILITFGQDVKVDQAGYGNISNIEPFYSSLRDGRFVAVAFITFYVYNPLPTVLPTNNWLSSSQCLVPTLPRTTGI